MTDERKPIEIRRTPWDDSIYEKARLAFEMNHEMSYHEMCGVIERLRAEVERLRATADAASVWRDECRGLGHMILSIEARYRAAKDTGGDDELLMSSIEKAAAYVDGPLRAKVDYGVAAALSEEPT